MLPHLDGWLGFLDTHRREQKFIDRMLRAHPGLADRPHSELYDVAFRVRWAVTTWKIFVVSVLGAIAAYFLSKSIFIGLWACGLRLSNGVIFLLAVFAAVFTYERIRRAYISAALNRAIAEVYPTLFCKCGYCLLGLPERSRCPECGAVRGAVRDD